MAWYNTAWNAAQEIAVGPIGKGMAIGAGVGAVGGATYSLGSDRTSFLGGAFKGALLGAGLGSGQATKGIMGGAIAGGIYGGIKDNQTILGGAVMGGAIGGGIHAGGTHLGWWKKKAAAAGTPAAESLASKNQRDINREMGSEVMTSTPGDVDYRGLFDEGLHGFLADKKRLAAERAAAAAAPAPSAVASPAPVIPTASSVANTIQAIKETSTGVWGVAESQELIDSSTKRLKDKYSSMLNKTLPPEFETRKNTILSHMQQSFLPTYTEDQINKGVGDLERDLFDLFKDVSGLKAAKEATKVATKSLKEGNLTNSPSLKKQRKNKQPKKNQRR